MLEDRDMYTLAYKWDIVKMARIGQRSRNTEYQNWAAAADLALWCLQGNASRRPQSMEQVLQHRFFDPAGNLRFLESTNEAWDLFTQRQAAALHTAIERRDNAKVHALFSLGGVHICMVDRARSDSTAYSKESMYSFRPNSGPSKQSHAEASAALQVELCQASTVANRLRQCYEASAV